MKDKLDLNNPSFLDIIVDKRVFLVSAIAVLTVILALFIPHMKTDPGLESGVDKNADAYRNYKEFVSVFGNEEFILAVIRNEAGIDGRVLDVLGKMTSALESADKVEEVISLSNLKVFQKKGELFGSFSVLVGKNGTEALPDNARLAELKHALPIIDYLVSPDLKSLGVLIRVEEASRFDNSITDRIRNICSEIVKADAPAGTDFRIIGPAFIRQAIVRYNIQTGIVFGVLCMLIGTVVSVYVFRSIKVTVVTNVILATCVVWILGLMAVLKIPMNSTTVLSFGFIPIGTIEIVIHMVIRYHLFHRTVRERTGALKTAVRWLARPCLMCSATTAVGFGTLMVSSIPMVRQLGFIMSFGTIIAYALAMILTPAFFLRMKTMETPENKTIVRGWLDGFLGRLESAIFKYHRYFVAAGLLMIVVLFSGAPFIRSDAQILRMLSDKTPEVQDIQFVENTLAPVYAVELFVKANPEDFKKSQYWEKMTELEKKLLDIPEVISTDSLSPLLSYLNKNLESDSSKSIFSDPAKLPQILSLVGMGSEGKRVLGRFVNDDYNRARISVRIKNSPSIPINITMDHIQQTADAVMKDSAQAVVTGDLVVVATQTKELINDQIYSMFLAGIIITILMIIQMESVLLGIITLIPNIPPVAAVFGIMGWFGISLDAVTVFAATVAVGLAIDNTIHYLSQLKREMTFNQTESVEQCVGRAYVLTAKQISSWSTITLLGFLALVVSPFRPVVFFGILGCSSLLLGLYGDLIFIQSLILSSPRIRNVMKELIKKELE